AVPSEVIWPVRPAITGVTVPPGSEARGCCQDIGLEMNAGRINNIWDVRLKSLRQILPGLEEYCSWVVFAKGRMDNGFTLLSTIKVYRRVFCVRLHMLRGQGQRKKISVS